MDKSEYIRGVLAGHNFSTLLVNAALAFWHSGVPYDDAKKYLAVYAAKIPVVK